MIRKHSILLIGLIACLATGFAHAEKTNSAGQVSAAGKSKGEEFRELGDLAPAFNVKEWVKGRPVKVRPGTNIYVLVFCTLSRANEFAITNLNGLQKRYEDKGVKVVVISDEPVESLRDFIQVKGAGIEFAVAADDESRMATSTFQRAFNQMMLPRAYVVGKDGKVLWLGHPLRDDLGLVVDEIASGRYDLEQTKKNVVAKQQMEQYLAMARQDDPSAEKVGQIMLILRTNDAPALCDLAFRIATDPYIEKRDVALATAALDRAAQLATTNATDIAVDRAVLLFQTGKETEGLAKARQALASAQSEEDKQEVNACIRAMEARLSAAKSSQTNSNSTNLPAGKP